MRSLLEFYWAQTQACLGVQFQYRAEMVLWLIGMIVEPTVYLIVWKTVVQSRGAVQGLSLEDFAAYYILTMLVHHLTFTWIMWEYEYYVRTGSLAGLLLKPIHPIHRDIADNLSYKLLTSAVMVPSALILCLCFKPRFHLELWSTVAFLPTLGLAAALQFVTGWTLAMSAFWLTRVGSINALYFVSLLFFTGRMAPLELYPQWLRNLANLTPFPWMIAFPVDLLLGKRTPRDFLLGFIVLLTWLFFCLRFMQIVWKAGLKRFSAVGS